MKLLFDQNISHRAVERLKTVFTEAAHVRDFDMQFSTDRQIWNFAKDKGFNLVTFDSDFNDLATLYGFPPKIIWLRFGNTLTQNLVDKLIIRRDLISSFLTDPAFSEIACLEIDY